MPQQSVLVQRAQPWLGTLVSMQLRVEAQQGAGAALAIAAAFEEVALVHRLMSAHTPGSELARLAQARAGEAVAVHPHTREVLRLAQRWARASGGAFDAQAAGEQLARTGRRPALAGGEEGAAGAARLLSLEIGEQLAPGGPLRLDLGGLAKGYAVDEAVRVLRAHGMPSGLVNAGGDLRAFGPHAWAVELQHASVRTRSQRLLRLRDAAVATSVHGGASADFVATRKRHAHWQRCTVLARDCASADALTKWGLQAPPVSLQLRATLSRLGARLWRD